DRVDVIEAGDEGAPQHGLAAPGGNVPPALDGPALVLLVADRDPDPVAGVIAEPEIVTDRFIRHLDCGLADHRAGERGGADHAQQETNYSPGKVVSAPVRMAHPPDGARADIP